MSEAEKRAPEVALAEAVGRTKGLQPWRRAFHAMNGTLIAVALSVLGLQVSTATRILGVGLVLAVILDLARLFDPRLNLLFFRAFSSLASPREARKIASSTWYVVSVLVVLVFFPKSYAVGGILVLALADPSASVVGQLWGRKRFLAGTVLGTATFALVAFLTLLLFVPWWMALITAIIGAIVEAAPTGLDDNLIVPITIAGVLLLIGG
jgi:dolichol kinase